MFLCVFLFEGGGQGRRLSRWPGGYLRRRRGGAGLGAGGISVEGGGGGKHYFSVQKFPRSFGKITKQSLCKANSFACSLANRDKLVAATLQRKCSGGITFVIITKEMFQGIVL